MNDDCYIKVEVKYSTDAERDGFCSMWTSKLLDRRNAYKVFNHLAVEMQGNKKGNTIYTIGLFDELVQCRRERDNLRRRNEFLESTDLPRVLERNNELSKLLQNSEAQLGEANSKIAELHGKLIRTETRLGYNDGLQREIERMKQALGEFVDEATEILDG